MTTKEFARQIALFAGDLPQLFLGMRLLVVQIVGASLLGVLASLFRRFVPSMRRVAALLFLLFQLLLIYLAADSGIAGIVAAILLFCGFALLVSTGKTDRRLQRAAYVFFDVFVAVWFIEKYLLPFGTDLWLAGKYPALAPVSLDMRMIAIVGISYMGFKYIHFVVDHAAGEIENVDPIEFLNWMLFFPSIVAGPMQRYEDWETQRSNVRFTAEMCAKGLQRLISGLFLKYVLADTIYGLSLANMSDGALVILPLWQIALSAIFYALYLYWDFSGYSHMAIGIGLFWGIELPENFNWPFAARNLAEFWNRWHITLSQILRDYIYYPISLKLKRLPYSKSHPNVAAAIPPLITFLIAGIWHGAAVGFVLYGLTQGAGLAYLAVRARRKVEGSFAKWWMQSRLGYVTAASLNFAYVTVSFIFFCSSYDKLTCLWHRLAG